MKRILIVIFLLPCSIPALSQVVTFNKPVYNAGEEVRATVLGGLTGIENDITGVSSKESDGDLSLGTPATWGFYSIKFTFVNGTKTSFQSHIVMVLPTGASSSDPLVYDLNYRDNAKEDPKSVFPQVFEYFRALPFGELAKPVEAGLKKFSVDNGVSVVNNVSFCLVAGKTGLPVLAAICRDLSVDNVQKLSLEVFRQIFLDMRTRGYLTAVQYQEIVNNIGAYASIKAVISSNCSKIFEYINTKVDSDDLKLAISWQDQLCSKTEIIIKHYKKIP